MVAHAFNPSTWEAEGSESLGCETSLVYRESSKDGRETLSQENKAKINKQTNK